MTFRATALILLYFVAAAKIQGTAIKKVVISDVGVELDREVYDATDDGSGYPFYLDDDPDINCPRPCTCPVYTTIYCSRQGITGISTSGSNGDSLFSGTIPTLATIMHLGFNNIEALPALLFSSRSGGFDRNVLRNLYLQSNKITTVHPDAFATMPYLEILDLSNNRISRIIQICEDVFNSTVTASQNDLRNLSCSSPGIPVNFLKSLSNNMISINLNSNLLNGIPNYSFSSFSKLKELRLSWNKIRWIGKSAFHGLQNLELLQLRSNHFNAVTASRLSYILHPFSTYEPATPKRKQPIGGIFDGDDYNAVETTEGSDQAKLRSATGTIRISSQYRASLKVLDLGSSNIANVSSLGSRSLERLYLDMNHIIVLPRKILEDASELKLLHLGGNFICSIPDKAFQYLKSLQVLDLSRNNVSLLTKNSFKGLNSLNSLRLNANKRLNFIPKGIFSTLRSLRMLYLHDCNLRSLPAGPWIYRLVSLWLYGNPIDCSCHVMFYLLGMLHTASHSVFKLKIDPHRSLTLDDSDTWPYRTLGKTTCAQPARLRGCEITFISQSDLDCPGKGQAASSEPTVQTDVDENSCGIEKRLLKSPSPQQLPVNNEEFYTEAIEESQAYNFYDALEATIENSHSEEDLSEIQQRDLKGYDVDVKFLGFGEENMNLKDETPSSRSNESEAEHPKPDYGINPKLMALALQNPTDFSQYSPYDETLDYTMSLNANLTGKSTSDFTSNDLNALTLWMDYLGITGEDTESSTDPQFEIPEHEITTDVIRENRT